MEKTPYILLIEDSPSQAMQLQLLIERWTKYPVSIARDGAEGWKQASTEPLPTLIFLDVNLPILGGFQVLSRLKKHALTKHIPVIIMTTSDNVSDVEQAALLGADDYMFKNDWLHSIRVAKNQLLTVIDHFLNE